MNIEYSPSGLDKDCYDSAKCVDGNDERFCGEALIKLPGFSLFSFFISLFLIGIYHFLSGKFKYNERLDSL